MNPVKRDKMSSIEERAAWLKAIDGPEFTARLDSWTDQFMRQAEATTALVTSPDSDEGRTAQRLVLIGMIRGLVGVGSTRQDGWPRAEPKAAKSLKEFVHHEPPPPIRSVVQRALYLYFRYSRSFLQGLLKAPAGRNAMQEHFELMFGVGVQYMLSTLQPAVLPTDTPRALSRSNLSLFGVYYGSDSVACMPS